MNGGSGFNEVFFTDVRIPDANRIGDVDDGWRCAIAMLMNERVAIGSGGGGGRSAGVKPLVELARRRGVAGDPVVRQGIADVYIRTQIMGYIGQQTRAAVKAGKAPGPGGSIGKLAGAQLARRTSDLAMAIAGAGGQAWEDSATLGGPSASSPRPVRASPAAPTRCNATSSANVCSDCRRSLRSTASSPSRSSGSAPSRPATNWRRRARIIPTG